jgi:hypothetical protein
MTRVLLLTLLIAACSGDVKSVRYPFSWQVDYYNSSGGLGSTLNSQFSDSIAVPGSAYFFC